MDRNSKWSPMQIFGQNDASNKNIVRFYKMTINILKIKK